ncbi:GH1 family beta-glucosidase [Polycladidibacter hongkongensis]|uniref:GH1 family beta-glucosidase n=1 Tax=Polycladidibacter hongkongensis TaxID=1647556 RepID=UPI00082A56F1|nr:GH1 family beta-glucosidase [Pseudovibrio hongkongensis]
MSSAKQLAARFPKGFMFGVATAAYQIEGAANEGGRKPSIWDAFSKMPGRVFEGHTGEVACDHYHLWESDLDLIKELGVEAYRLSIAWPRVIPDGRGAVNEEGLDFYDRLIDGLVARNIKVFPTLYHWDLPLALAGFGGWTCRDTADAFGEYTSAVVKRLGDRIDGLATLNEPWCASYLSHLIGAHAPGEKSMEAAIASVHTFNLAHGTAVLAARAERADIQMGVVLNSFSTYAASDSAEDKAAVERFYQFNNGAFLSPMFAGKYDEGFLAAHGDKMDLREGDLERIHQPLDWWGYNFYNPETVKHDPAPDAVYPATIGVPSTDSDVRTDIGWEIRAEGLTDFLVDVYKRYDMPPVYITENGAAYNMGPVDGVVDDQPRLEYYEKHIGAVADALDKGVPLKGYFAWSLMDNYEWAFGYSMRFGIVHVDYETQQRTIKKSGYWYQDLVATHRALAEVEPA